MRIVVSAATIASIQSHALPGSLLSGVRRLDSERYEIELDEDVVADLLRIDKDLNQAILTLCSARLGHA